MSENINETQIKDLFEVGAHFAYAKARRHPSTAPYIFGAKNGVEIFDLTKTSPLLDDAKTFISKLAAENKQILFVGGKHESQGIIKDFAMKLDTPYVVGRWIGGTLTNFEEISKRVARLADLSSKKEKGLLGGYTKKERLLIDREIERLTDRFGGLESMKRRPAAVFVIDSGFEDIAVAEAIKEGIPTIALSSSDCDITKITYPIVGNDTAVKTIQYVVSQLAEAYEEGKANAPKPTEKSVPVSKVAQKEA